MTSSEMLRIGMAFHESFVDVVAVNRNLLCDHHSPLAREFFSLDTRKNL